MRDYMEQSKNTAMENDALTYANKTCEPIFIKILFINLLIWFFA